MTNCPLTIDFHRGHLLIADDVKLMGWDVMEEIDSDYVVDNELHVADFEIIHNERFDPNYI